MFDKTTLRFRLLCNEAAISNYLTVQTEKHLIINRPRCQVVDSEYKLVYRFMT